MIKRLVLYLIKQYGRQAKQMVKVGRRPDYLPCESDGVYCSAKFVAQLQKNGLTSAVKDLMLRCPKGQTTAVQALAYSTSMAFVPVLAVSADKGGGYKPEPGRDLSTPCDGPMGCG